MTTPRELVAIVPENSIRFLGHDTHEHEVPHLIHVVTGVADIVADGERIPLHARENLWLAANVPHSVRLPSGGIVLGPLLSPATKPRERVQRLGALPALTELMTTILAAAPVTAEQVRPFREALDGLLRPLCRHYFPLVLPSHPVARAIAREAARSPQTLHELAARHGTSVRHVQRLFHDQTGLPFTRWRARARLNVAITRLGRGDSLTVAAGAAGYTSRNGLLKALSRETGLPSARLGTLPLAVLDAHRAAA
ncbi:AraC family transcriptional regulator [Prauserella marina]|uniref:Helix-turn-helix domain-containing protein n=1 Tax=Prauserella marina TaxID=530584 RepID=A0A222VPJ7_9PSEU|nr:helix-turn-helix transcriptional regulator [Prauserella marina]ASR35673.1 AraC family transcriptional regulator [Prauserella marina]PWV84451.1 helix-turn-helix protein [Prauserella marina]SDC22250.1 Helix-turn-helix domain-containing protein [Prauserella marina]